MPALRQDRRTLQTTDAVVIRRHGSNERFELTQVPTPAGRGQLLVTVEASGVDYADVRMRRGI